MSTVSLHGDDDEEIEPGQRYDEEEEPVCYIHASRFPRLFICFCSLIVLSILIFHERFQLMRYKPEGLEANL